MDTIIRAPKGSLRKTVKVDEIIIPDLWHVAMYHQDAATKPSLNHVERAWHKKQAEMILDTWHLTHDLITNIQADRDNIKL